MTRVNEYRLYCYTEETNVTGWGTIAPTACYHNTEHEIDLDSVTIIDYVDEEIVKANVIEENNPTGERYQAKQFLITPTTGADWQIFNFSMPKDVTVKKGTVYLQDACVGDEMSCHMSPDTIIGIITSDVTAEETEISVSETVINNIFTGAEVKLYDGVNQDNCGMVLDVDADTNKITVQTATTHSFSASSPTYVQMTVCFVHLIKIVNNSIIELGENAIKGFYWPANTILQVKYKNNNSGEGKEIGVIMEYYY